MEPATLAAGDALPRIDRPPRTPRIDFDASGRLCSA